MDNRKKSNRGSENKGKCFSKDEKKAIRTLLSIVKKSYLQDGIRYAGIPVWLYRHIDEIDVYP